MIPVITSLAYPGLTSGLAAQKGSARLRSIAESDALVHCIDVSMALRPAAAIGGDA